MNQRDNTKSVTSKENPTTTTKPTRLNIKGNVKHNKPVAVCSQQHQTVISSHDVSTLRTHTNTRIQTIHAEIVRGGEHNTFERD